MNAEVRIMLRIVFGMNQPNLIEGAMTIFYRVMHCTSQAVTCFNKPLVLVFEANFEKVSPISELDDPDMCIDCHLLKFIEKQPIK